MLLEWFMRALGILATCVLASAANAQTSISSNWVKEPSAFLGIKLGEPITLPVCPSSKGFIDHKAVAKLEGVCRDPDKNGSRTSVRLYNEPKLGFYYKLYLSVEDGVAESVNMFMKEQHFQEMLGVLTERYGPPSIAREDVAWIGNKVSIFMRQHGQDGESGVSIRFNGIAEKKQKEREEKRSREAKKF